MQFFSSSDEAGAGPGLDQAAIDVLPAFPYRDLLAGAAVAAAARGKRLFDCAVCLCVFDDDDRLRLLSLCGHAFHAACIDTWLCSSSTCPLYRTALSSRSIAAPGAAVADTSAQPDVEEQKVEQEASDEAARSVVLSVRLGRFKNTQANDAAAMVVAVVTTTARRGGRRRAAAVALLVVALLLAASPTASAASSYPASEQARFLVIFASVWCSWGLIRVCMAEVVTGLLSSTASAMVKQLWSLKSTTRTAAAAAAARSMVKYDGGYTVETVFDGSKLGIEPYDVEVTPAGELLVLDSMNSNIYRVQLPLSRSGQSLFCSPQGLSGHVDGRLREAKMNHPRGFTVDGRGNIYVADAMNTAIRKISDTGVTTIAGGKSTRGHIDGLSDDAKFSTDFEIRYISSSCSLLVIDKGNQAIREILLHSDDCEYPYEANFPLGIALLFAAGFFGYMLALVQRRVLGMVSTTDEPQTPPRPSIASIPPYQKPLKPSLRPQLIPTEDQAGNQEAEDGFFTSMGRLIGGAKSSMAEMFSRKKRRTNQYHHQQGRANLWPVQESSNCWPVQESSNLWPVQESYAIPHDEKPPPLDTRAPTPQKNYTFMTKEPEKIHHVRHGRPCFSGWDVQHAPQQLLQQHRQTSAAPQTFFEQSCKTTTKEIVFGAVQEMDTKQRMVEIKAVNYGDTFYEQYGMRYRNNYIGYNNSSGNNYF
ncbi:hypothetical protein ABZP36_011153 [Zizania latifolia]